MKFGKQWTAILKCNLVGSSRKGISYMRGRTRSAKILRPMGRGNNTLNFRLCVIP